MARHEKGRLEEEDDVDEDLPSSHEDGSDEEEVSEMDEEVEEDVAAVDWMELVDLAPFRFTEMQRRVAEQLSISDDDDEDFEERHARDAHHDAEAPIYTYVNANEGSAWETAGPATYYVGGFSAVASVPDALRLVRFREDEVAVFPSFCVGESPTSEQHEVAVCSKIYSGVTIRHAFLDPVKIDLSLASLPPRSLASASVVELKNSLRLLRLKEAAERNTLDANGEASDGVGEHPEAISRKEVAKAQKAATEEALRTLEAELNTIGDTVLLHATFGRASRRAVRRVAHATTSMMSNQSVQLLCAQAIWAKRHTASLGTACVRDASQGGGGHFLSNSGPEVGSAGTASDPDSVSSLEVCRERVHAMMRVTLPPEQLAFSQRPLEGGRQRRRSRSNEEDEDGEDGGGASELDDHDGDDSQSSNINAIPRHANPPRPTLASHLIALYGIPVPQLNGALRLSGSMDRSGTPSSGPKVQEPAQPVLHGKALGVWVEHLEDPESEEDDAQSGGDVSETGDEGSDAEHGPDAGSDSGALHPRERDYGGIQPCWRWLGRHLVASPDGEDGTDGAVAQTAALRDLLRDQPSDHDVIYNLDARDTDDDDDDAADEEDEAVELKALLLAERKKELARLRLFPPVRLLGLQFRGGCGAASLASAVLVECTLGSMVAAEGSRCAVTSRAFAEVDFVSCAVWGAGDHAVYGFPKSQSRFFACSISGSLLSGAHSSALFAPPPFLPPLVPAAVFRITANSQSPFSAIPPARGAPLFGGPGAHPPSPPGPRSEFGVWADGVDPGDDEEEESEEERLAYLEEGMGTRAPPLAQGIFRFDASGRPIKDVEGDPKGRREMKRAVRRLLPWIAAATIACSTAPTPARQTLVAGLPQVERHMQQQLKEARSKTKRAAVLRRVHYLRNIQQGAAGSRGIPIHTDGREGEVLDVMAWFDTAAQIAADCNAGTAPSESWCRSGIHLDGSSMAFYFCTVSAVDVGFISREDCQESALFGCRLLQCFQVGVALLAGRSARVEHCVILSAGPGSGPKARAAVGSVLGEQWSQSCTRAALYADALAHPHLTRNIFLGFLSPDRTDRGFQRYSKAYVGRRPVVPRTADEASAAAGLESPAASAFPFLSAGVPKQMLLHAAPLRSRAATPTAPPPHSDRGGAGPGVAAVVEPAYAMNKDDGSGTVVLRCSDRATQTGIRDNVVFEYDACESKFRRSALGVAPHAHAPVAPPGAGSPPPCDEWGWMRAEAAQRGFRWINGVY